MFGGRFSLVAVVNDGQMDLSLQIVNVSPVIRALAIAEAHREQAKYMHKLFINIHGTVQDLKTLEWYVHHANDGDDRQPGTKDLPTLITVGEMAVKLKIPGIADLVTVDIGRVLVPQIEDGGDVKDYPWHDLCRVAANAVNDKLADTIAWCFLNAARETRSQQDALWALEIGETVHRETGNEGLRVYALYLCVIWGAFRLVPQLTRTWSSGVHGIQITMVTLMEGLATPRLCEAHHSQECISGDFRQRCVTHWRAVWQEAHRVAGERIRDEYKEIYIGGPERDVLRMLRLISSALQEITQRPPTSLISPACDLKRLHASNRWLLEQQATVRAIIKQLPRERFVQP